MTINNEYGKVFMNVSVSAGAGLFQKKSVESGGKRRAEKTGKGRSAASSSTRMTFILKVFA